MNVACFSLKTQLRAAGAWVHVTDNEAETLENLYVLNMSHMGLLRPAMLTPLRPPKNGASVLSRSARNLKASVVAWLGLQTSTPVRYLDLDPFLLPPFACPW